MKRLVKATCGFTAGLALAAGSATPAMAQFVSVNNYQPPVAQQAQAPLQAQVYPQHQFQYQYQPQQAAAPGYSQAYAPQAYAPQVASSQVYAPPTHGYPRVAQQPTELPAPAETVTPPAQPTPAAAEASAPTMYNEGYAQPTQGYLPHDGSIPTASYPTSSYAAPAAGDVATGDCATGNCGVGYTDGYNYGAQSCDVGAPACDVGGCAYPSAPRRQWFAGIYGLYLDRAGDSSKRAVAYLEDDQNAYMPGTDYYPMPGMPTLFTADAGDSGMWGAEVRFGSTFGCDPCNCMQPYAWEVGYWGIDNDASDAYLTIPGVVANGYAQRLYTMLPYDDLNVDRDGAGMNYTNRQIYEDEGAPADGDIYSHDTRVLGIRVRQRFTAQNLELNFWRFGTPTAVGGCGMGACAPSACDTGCDPCGMSGYAGYGGCAPCRPPRRFFINGVCGVRYMRIDDDFGLDWQFTTVDGTGMPNTMPMPEPDRYMPMLESDNNMLFSTYQADNELVGFQLGGSMNWLCGCRWNFFADTNFGIYGNNASVYKRVYGGGGSMVTFAEDGMLAEVNGSETSLAYVGELRAGVGYQVTCNCRVTAAYRFIGIGGVALGVEEFQNTNWANSEYASHIDTNNSLILHGLQTGVEYKF